MNKMMKPNFSQLVIPLIVGALQAGSFFISGEIYWVEVFLLIFGMYLGVAILWIDKYFLYEYYLDSGNNTDGLATRSIVFMMALVPLAIFINSSTGSRIGAGVILGIITSLAQEMWSLQNHPQEFKDTFLFQLKRVVSDEEIKKFVMWVMIAVSAWCLQVII